MEKFSFFFFCIKGSGRYGLDKGSVTYGQTDGRTDVHTRREEQYMSPAGGDIQFSKCRITYGPSRDPRG